MPAKKGLSALVIAATYIGTVVGAGFASGQEVLQFFGFFGIRGLAGLGVTTVLLAFFGYIILELGRRLKADSYLPVIRYAGGKYIGTAIDWVITFFLFGGLVAMSAGAGAIFVEQYGVSFTWGSLALSLLTLATVLIGFTGAITSISIMVPLLLTAIFGMAAYTLMSNFDALLSVLGVYAEVGRAPVPYWPFTALLYASYNLVLAVAVLAPMGAMSSKSSLKSGALLGAIGLGLGAMAINLAVLTHIGTASGYEIPMIFVAGSISPVAGAAYTAVLLAGVYTTAVASLYGFVSRLSRHGSLRYILVTAAASTGAFGLAQAGFSNIVGTLFPAVGFAGLLLLGTLVYAFFKDRFKMTELPVDLTGHPPPGDVVFEFAEDISPNEKSSRRERPDWGNDMREDGS